MLSWHTKKLIGITVTAIVVVILITVVFPPLPTSHSSTLLSSGTIKSVGPDKYYCVNFTAPTGAYSISISGSYTSNNNIEVGVLTARQLGAFTQNESTIADARWYSGNNVGSTISLVLFSSGTPYYLVIYNGNSSTSDTVTIDNAIALDYTTPGWLGPL